MKFLLATVLGVFFLSSCAHHHKDVEHHHHKSCNENCKTHHEKGEMFDRHCAQSISEGDLHVKGKDDYKIKHGGQVYYFSTKDKLQKFKKNIEASSKRARKNWDVGGANR